MNFKVTLTVDNSAKPKLEKKISHIVLLLLSLWIVPFICTLPILIMADTPGSDVNDSSALISAAFISLVIFILYSLVFIIHFKRCRKFNKYIKEHTFECDAVAISNSLDCICVLKSGANELCSVNLDKLIRDGGACIGYRKNDNELSHVVIKNMNTEFVYMGLNIRCAIKISSSDKKFMSLLEASGVVS